MDIAAAAVRGASPGGAECADPSLAGEWHLGLGEPGIAGRGVALDQGIVHLLATAAGTAIGHIRPVST